MKRSFRVFPLQLEGMPRPPRVDAITQKARGEQWFTCDSCQLDFPASELVYRFDRVMKKWRLLCTTGRNDAEYLNDPRYIPIEDRSYVEPEDIDRRVFPRPRPRDVTEQGETTHVHDDGS